MWLVKQPRPSVPPVQHLELCQYWLFLLLRLSTRSCTGSTLQIALTCSVAWVCCVYGPPPSALLPPHPYLIPTPVFPSPSPPPFSSLILPPFSPLPSPSSFLPLLSIPFSLPPLPSSPLLYIPFSLLPPPCPYATSLLHPPSLFSPLSLSLLSKLLFFFFRSYSPCFRNIQPAVPISCTKRVSHSTNASSTCR